MTTTHNVNIHNDVREDVAHCLLAHGAISITPAKVVKFRNTNLPPVTHNLPRLLTYPNIRESILKHIHNMFWHVDSPVIGVFAISQNGIPWVCEEVFQRGWHLVFPRPEMITRYRDAPAFDTNIKHGKSYAMFIDTVDNSKELCKTILYAREQGMIISQLFTIFDFGFPKMRKNLETLGISVIALCTLDDIIHESPGAQDRHNTIELWRQDPELWEKNKA